MIIIGKVYWFIRKLFNVKLFNISMLLVLLSSNIFAFGRSFGGENLPNIILALSLLILGSAIFYRMNKNKVAYEPTLKSETSEKEVEESNSLVEKLDQISQLDVEVENIEKIHHDKLMAIEKIRKNSISQMADLKKRINSHIGDVKTKESKIHRLKNSIKHRIYENDKDSILFKKREKANQSEQDKIIERNKLNNSLLDRIENRVGRNVEEKEAIDLRNKEIDDEIETLDSLANKLNELRRVKAEVETIKPKLKPKAKKKVKKKEVQVKTKKIKQKNK